MQAGDVLINRYGLAAPTDAVISVLGLHRGYMAYNEFYEVAMSPLLALVAAKFDLFQRFASQIVGPWTAAAAAEVVIHRSRRGMG